MGLLFALQVDGRKSRSDTLVLASTKRRFAMGAGLLFGAGALAVMVLAASPLFKVFWEEGQWFDRALTLFFYGSIALYPCVAFFSWFFEERVTLTFTKSSGIDLEKHQRFLGIRWGHQRAHLDSLDSLEMTNHRDSLNEAARRAERLGRTDRYGTKGHWILKTSDGFEIERRAKKEDLEFLLFQIQEFRQKLSS